MVSVITLRVAQPHGHVALTHTGLSRESAKFQARSAFTGVGFTTSESEKVVNPPRSRSNWRCMRSVGIVALKSHAPGAGLSGRPIRWDREHSQRHFGLRTFPLVAVVTCGFIFIGMSVISSTDGEARVIQAIITGIGFIGGGAICKDKDKVAGTASAASIWNTGAIGLAVTFDRLEIAMVLSALNFFSLFVFGRVKREADKE